jgi:hypothetical protein
MCEFMIKLFKYIYYLSIVYMDNKFVFFKGLDSVGYDLTYVGKKPVNELKKLCLENDKCIGFNTLGYMKKSICPKAEMQKVSLFTDPSDGLYVCIDKYNALNPNNKIDHTSALPKPIIKRVIDYSKKPKLCLNMIVKNEAHVITDTLESVCDYIDYYVINDTGSTDNTIEVITNFFNARGIKGEIHSHEFRTCKCHMDFIYKKYDFFHFGWNRSYALDLCKGKSEYIIVIDADDIIMGKPDFSKLFADCYSIKIGKDFTYDRVQIFKNDPKFNWKYTGVLHEAPDCDKKNRTEERLPGDFYLDSRRLGDRSKDPKKYLRDAQIFEIVLKDEPNNFRYMFYCGQSYFDYKDFKNSMKWYKKRIAGGGWYEEVYYSYFRIGECMQMLKFPWPEVEKAYMAAYKFCETRLEALFAVAKHYFIENDFENCYKFARQGENTRFPTKCKLFLTRSVYDFGIKSLVAESAFKLGKYTESYSIYKKLLQQNLVPNDSIDKIKTQMKEIDIKINDAKKRTCCIYVGYIHLNKNHVAYDFVNELAIHHKVYLVGDHIQSYDFDNVVILSINSARNYYSEPKKSKQTKKSTTVTMMPDTESEKHTFDYLFLLDNINYYFDEIGIKSNLNYLVMFTTDIKLYIPNGSFVSVFNNELLNKLLTNIKKIICVDTEEDNPILTTIMNNYTLTKNDIDLLKNISDITKYFENTNKKRITQTKFVSTVKNNSNGFVLRIPDNINYMINNRLSLNPIYDVNLEFYDGIIKYMKNIPEAYLFKISYFDMIGNQAEMNKTINELPKTITPELKDIVSSFNIKTLMDTNGSEETYGVLTDILRKNTIAGNLRFDVEKSRDSLIDSIKDQFTKYPAVKIKNIKPTGSKNIVLSITTCKRFDLFEKTMNSFINCCEDLDLIDHWICVDDNSSESDRYKMKKLYPFFEFILKDEKQKGHYVSMNIIQEYAIKNDVKYLLHTEDDWLYFEKDRYITKFLEILNENKSIGQVLFNRNYYEVGRDEIYINGGFLNFTKNGLRYYIHEYYPKGTPEYQNFLKKYNGFSTCGYWPHFSFRPSLINCKIYNDLGLFYNTPHFEMAYANDYVMNGWISAFLDTYACTHIGKKTWEQDGSNSYKLNGTEQFTFTNNEMNIFVLNNQSAYGTSRDLNIFKKFKASAHDVLPFYIKQNLFNTGSFSEFHRKILMNNDFHYRRDITNYLLTLVELISASESKNLMVIKDNMIFNDNIKDSMKYLFDVMLLTKNYSSDQISRYDMILLNTGTKTNKDISIDSVSGKNVNIYDNSIGGFVLTLSGITKILNFLKGNNITTMHDLFSQDHLDIYELNNDVFHVFDPNQSILNTIEQNTEHVTIYPGYKFYSQMDSFGDDLSYQGSKSIDELIEMCNNDPKCVGFNTSGWMKFAIKPENQLSELPQSMNISEGLYVKI